MKISVIIPTYNSEETIVPCLDSIYKTAHKDFEVVVVDDGSTDGTLRLLSQYPCRVVRLENNSGASVARNTGARNAAGELLYFVDSDIVQQTDNLSLAQAILAREPGVEIVCAAPRWEALNRGFGSEFMGLKYYYDYYLLLTRGIHRVESSWFQALGGFIPKKLFLECGGFDEAFHLGGEEYKFGQRLNSLGHKIHIFLDLEVSHYWWGIRERIRLNYRRSQDWLPTLLARKTFESSGGIATGKNVVNTFILTTAVFLSALAPFAQVSYLPAVLFLGYYIYNMGFYRYIYAKKHRPGFVLLAMAADVALYSAIGIGTAVGIFKLIFRPKA